MKYYLFLDESGDHGLSSIDGNFPIFLLCGCLISEVSLKELQNEIRKFKVKYFNSENVILHSILKKSNFISFGSAVKKDEHIKKYGKTAKDPYALCLSFVLERMIFCLDDIKDSTVEIIIEKRGKREDAQLLVQYNTILDLGTYFIKPYRLKKKITSFDSKWKKENIIGLQITDLIAYPIARSVLQPNIKYPTYEIIKDKMYCSKNGKIEGFGIKIFP